MSTLFVVLFAGSPIIGVVFAASLVGLRLPAMHLPLKINRPTDEELDAMRLAAREVARRHNPETRFSLDNKPAPAPLRGTWRQVLGLPLNEHRRSVAHQAYRALARANHPDASGSNEAMQAVNDAWRQAKRQLVLK